MQRSYKILSDKRSRNRSMEQEGVTMLLLTPKKAQALLTVGDTVYFIRNGAVQSRTVKAILKDCLDVGDDLFFFDEVAKLWFLTEKGAREKMR